MSIGHRVAITGAVVSLAVTSSLALYYRNEASRLRGEWSAAKAHLEKAAAESRSRPTAPRTAAQPKTTTSHSNLDHGHIADAPAREPVHTPTETAKPRLPETAAAPDAITTERSSESPLPRRRGTDWIETLKTNDPPRYAAIQQRRRETEQNAETAWLQTSDYFLNRDTANMGDQDMEEYSRLVSMLDETRALALQLQAGLPPDQRWQVMSTVRSNMTALVPLLNNERNRELFDLATAVGQNAADAAAWVGYVNQITSNTAIRTIFPDIMRGGAGGGRGFDRSPPAPPSSSPP